MSHELAHLPENVARIATVIGNEAMLHGAAAVVLAGSHARGDAQPESDIDLYVIGDGPDYRLERRGDHLVSISWVIERESRASLHDPAKVGAVVPGWRRALIVTDPARVAAALRSEAERWDWSVIGDDVLDGWVAEEVTGYAEEVHKLVASLRTGNQWMASVQRSILALRLAIPMSVQCRILYESENQLWQMVADAAGSEWATAQAGAFGLAAENHTATCRAALTLFALAAQSAWPLMDARQREVVGHAMSLASSG